MGEIPAAPNGWQSWHYQSRIRRWAVKWGALALVTLGVLYPRPWLLPQWIARLAHPETVLDPTHPGLGPMEVEIRVRVGAEAALADLAPVVEQLVCQRVPYAFDWDTWGVMDHLPTVGEVLDRGRDDCDGRAVVAASLVRRLGYQAWLVTDLKHTWVVARARDDAGTPAVELMGPGSSPTLLGGACGTQVTFRGLLRNSLHALTFGTAVFPLARELLLMSAVALLTMHPWSSRRRRITGGLLMLAGLIALRAAGPARVGLAGLGWLAITGLAAGTVGWCLLAWKSNGPRAAGDHSRPAPLR